MHAWSKPITVVVALLLTLPMLRMRRDFIKSLVLAAAGGIAVIFATLPHHFVQTAQAIQAVDAAKIEFFEAKVRPLLIHYCYDCHTDSAKGNLRVDSREALLKGGRRGSAIVIGKPEESLLIKAVAHTHETLRMPKDAPKLKEQEINDLSQWIKDGAHWPAVTAAKNDYLIKPEHKAFWSFQPVRNPAIPIINGKTNNAIDAFLLTKLEAKGLSFNAPADKRTLLRRATY